jgi:hypothetical protein
MTSVASNVVLDGLDRVWRRERGRCEGLSQAEYLWEPVAGCWSVRPVDGSDGVWRANERTDDEPAVAPVTTIAWRLWHIASECLADYTVRGLGAWPLAVEDTEWYGSVDEALAAVDRAWAAFREGLDALGEEGLWGPLGEQHSDWAAEPWAKLAVHAQAEVAHHGAEIGLLRDLWLHGLR